MAIILRRNPDRVVGADAAFILNKSLPVRKSPEGYLLTIPELVVEVRSKNDSRPEIAAKNDEYFDAGVELIWVIDPEARTVTVSRRGQPDETLSGNSDTLTCQLIPGFVVPRRQPISRFIMPLGPLPFVRADPIITPTLGFPG